MPSLRVLVADDEPVSRTVVGAMLTKAGYEVTFAPDGEQAPTYVILLTSRDSSADIVTGLKAGANDYVTKPANEDELVARVSVGARVVALQLALAERVRSLEEALANVKALQTLLPMCAYCKSPQRPELLGEGRDLFPRSFGSVVLAQLLPDLLRPLRHAATRRARERSAGSEASEGEMMATPWRCSARPIR
ncbi:MAG: hypothetical protein RJA55_688 [Acidobacteriota bacterium]|jgi:CheY-like chemotaxis protein